MSDPMKLDLDSIVPPDAEITLHGQVYKVRQPTIADLIFFSKIINDFQKAMTSVETTNTLKEFTDHVPNLIEGFDISLSTQQALSLLAFFFQITTPPEASLMAERNIQPTAQKKTSDTVS